LWGLPEFTPPGIFAFAYTDANGIPQDVRASNSVGGEDVIVDGNGKVWFSESGSSPYSGPNPNHGRIVMLDPKDGPNGGVLHTLNIPGDNNGISGLSWDATRGKIWFTETRRFMRQGFTDVVAYHARLTSFYPGCIGNAFCPNPPNYGIPNWVGNFNFDAEA